MYNLEIRYIMSRNLCCTLKKGGGDSKVEKRAYVVFEHVEELSDMLLNSNEKKGVRQAWVEFSVKCHPVTVWHRWNLLLEVFMLKIVLFCVLV